MTAIVGVFDDRSAAAAAKLLLEDVGFGEKVDVTQALSADDSGMPRLARRGETMLRSAIKWGIWGSLIIEIPSLIALLIFPLDVNIKILLAATVWKFGAAFGSWIGAMAVSEDGLDDETAADYEAHLADGRTLVAVDVQSRHRPGIRGILLESGALSVQNVRGTFVLKPAAPGVLQPSG